MVTNKENEKWHHFGCKEQVNIVFLVILYNKVKVNLLRLGIMYRCKGY